MAKKTSNKEIKEQIAKIDERGKPTMVGVTGRSDKKHMDQIIDIDDDLAKHPRIRARDKWYKCHYCKKKYEGKYNLRRHLLAIHKLDLAKDLDSTVEDVKISFHEHYKDRNEQ